MAEGSQPSRKERQSEPLEAARAAVLRSDKAQLPTQETRTLAVRDETQALRDAVRALIQHAEQQQETINRLMRKSYRFDPTRPIG